MELTLDQALQKGVEAHRAGQVQEADRLYTAILQTQPKHPDANHNMGILIVSLGKVQEALPFFKTALEANPNTEQFWLSYINALIALEQLTDAKAVFDQAKSNGAKGGGFDQIKKRLSVLTKTPTADIIVGQSLEQDQSNILDTLKLDQAIRLAKKNLKEGSMEEAKRIYQDILLKFPKNKQALDGLKTLVDGAVSGAEKVQDPPQDQLQPLIDFYNRGQFQQALEQAEVFFKQFPNSSVLYNICGGVYNAIGQLDASISAYNKALAINPGFALAFNNKGNSCQEQGKLKEAIEAYEKALSIEPNYAAAYSNMGRALTKQGKLKEAIKAYRKALAIKPDYAQAHNNIGMSLEEQGKLNEAIEAYEKALSIEPDFADSLYRIAAILFKQNDMAGVMKKLRLVNSNTSNFLTERTFKSLPYKILTELKNKEIETGNKGPYLQKREKPFEFPIIIQRPVEDELIKCLYGMKAQNLDDTIDARFGNGTCSPDYKLFDSKIPIIEKVSADLIQLMEDALSTKILFHESFFNIYGQGGGIKPHTHVLTQDLDFDLFKYKYSLVYYLSVGDQSCAEPGILKLYEPSFDILPIKGMCTLFPSSRSHSALYGGLEDRVMIGCNFYSV